MCAYLLNHGRSESPALSPTYLIDGVVAVPYVHRGEVQSREFALLAKLSILLFLPLLLLLVLLLPPPHPWRGESHSTVQSSTLFLRPSSEWIGEAHATAKSSNLVSLSLEWRVEAFHLAEPRTFLRSRPLEWSRPGRPSILLGPLLHKRRGAKGAEVPRRKGLDPRENVVEAEDASTHEGGFLDVLMLQDLFSTSTYINMRE